MVTGKEISQKDFSKSILEKLNFSKLQLEFAQAIYLGDKCNSISVAEIKKHTDTMVGKVMIYFGNTDFGSENARHYRQYKTLCDYACKEFFNEYPMLTIQEIVLAIQKGIRKYWGSYDTWNVSLKLFNELIVQYQCSDIRKNIIKSYNEAKDNISLQPVSMTEAEQEAFSMRHCLNQFEKFKICGIGSVVISATDYDYLITKCAMPDYKGCMVEAGKTVSTPTKNQTSVADVIDRVLHDKIILEAKRLTIIKLFQKLVDDDVSLVDYIGQSRIS